MRYYPKKKIFNETLYWSVNPRIDTHNEYALDDIYRAPRSQV
jgi:hypothetical protein